MTAAAQTAAAIPEEDRLRADLYNFLGLVLARAPDRGLLDQCAALRGQGGEIGAAIDALAAKARKSDPKKASREFEALFIGLGRGELLPYASYYLTGFLNEKPLALLRRDMAALGITRSANVYEPEDNAASLMEMMGALIVGRFGPPAPLSKQREFFARHVAPWAPHFFADLESAKGADLYAPVGALGRAFLAVESEGFRMSNVH
ncbi:molecular chaperone [Jannaschia sp. W003]|uniref:TorD/DmsD family molecular chaperone n=1 Tax=Jannaschia sp. W003 TaxID=2867012 RepID=UPI0021A2C293|nr:molecular chaperone TorD family protein [Jannaschia sp. W003]UWQ21475.1 molecular chaperone TorD family protein [Jannaschia sp. W003]